MAGSDLRAQVVAEARSWLRTPFAHQAHTKGVATDCGGLIAGVAIALGLLPSDFWERDFAPHAGYPRTPGAGLVSALCQRFLRPVHTRPDHGDVLLLRFSAEPQHLAIVTPYRHGGLAMIHAYSRARSVVEHRLADVWRARIVAAFALPGVA